MIFCINTTAMIIRSTCSSESLYFPPLEFYIFRMMLNDRIHDCINTIAMNIRSTSSSEPLYFAPF